MRVELVPYRHKIVEVTNRTTNIPGRHWVEFRPVHPPAKSPYDGPERLHHALHAVVHSRRLNDVDPERLATERGREPRLVSAGDAHVEQHRGDDVPRQGSDDLPVGLQHGPTVCEVVGDIQLQVLDV